MPILSAHSNLARSKRTTHKHKTSRTINSFWIFFFDWNLYTEYGEDESLLVMEQASQKKFQLTYEKIV